MLPGHRMEERILEEAALRLRESCGRPSAIRKDTAHGYMTRNLLGRMSFAKMEPGEACPSTASTAT